MHQPPIKQHSGELRSAVIHHTLGVHVAVQKAENVTHLQLSLSVTQNGYFEVRVCFTTLISFAFIYGLTLVFVVLFALALPQRFPLFLYTRGPR